MRSVISITSAKSFLICKVTYSQVLKIWMWASFGGALCCGPQSDQYIQPLNNVRNSSIFSLTPYTAVHSFIFYQCLALPIVIRGLPAATRPYRFSCSQPPVAIHLILSGFPSKSHVVFYLTIWTRLVHQ